MALATLSSMPIGCTELVHSCTNIGCLPDVEIALQPALAQPGVYAFSAVVDGEMHRCTAVLPHRARDASAVADDCVHSSVLHPIAGGIQARDGDAVTETAADTFAGVSVAGEPVRLGISIERDGVELVSAELQPVYRGVEINGEGCGECPMANEVLPLPP